MPGIWPSISWPIDRVLRIGFVISWRPEITTLPTTFPRSTMLILIVGIAHAKAFVLDLAIPAASKRHIGRIATYPLLTTWRFDQRRLGIATKTTMLTGNRLGFHTVVCHGVPCLGGAKSALIGTSKVHHAPDHSMLWGIFHPTSTPMAWPRTVEVDPSVHDEPIFQNETQSKSVETQSQAAR